MSLRAVLLGVLVGSAFAAACGGNKCGTPIRPCSNSVAYGGSGGDASTRDAGVAADSGEGSSGDAGTQLLIGVGSFGLRGRSEDGSDWRFCGNPAQGDDHTPDLLRAVAYGGGVFIAVGGDQNGRVMRSVDGEHWAEDVHPRDACPGEDYPSSCSSWMGAVAYDPIAQVWLAGGGNGATMRSLDGGSTWQGLHRGFPEKHIRGLVAGAGVFIASSDGGDVYITRDAGESWTGGNVWSGANNAYLRVVHGTHFIAYSEAGDACFVSDNRGDSWQPCAAEAHGGTAYLFDGKQWIAARGDHYATSMNARDWTTHPAAARMPERLLFDGTTYFGRSKGTVYRASALDAFEVVASQVPDFRAWTLGRVLDRNLPVTGIAACVDRR